MSRHQNRGQRGAAARVLAIPVHPARNARALIMAAAWCILAAILCVFLLLADVHAGDKKPTPQPENRQDLMMGTFHEGMSMERDEDTGDVFMRAGPKPKAKQEPEDPPITVTPEVTIPVKP